MDKLSNDILNNITVLYVEDEESTRIELSKFLKRRVGRLVVAPDGEYGMEMIDRYDPDIIITDFKMPGMSGLDMIKKARERGFEGGFIITSAVSDSQIIIDALDIGVVRYMIKPVDTEKLIDYLNELSESIIREKTDITILDHKYILDRDKKKEAEELIKSQTAFFIKKKTGKGPKVIRVFIQGDTISIDAEEVLTVYEQSVLENVENYSLIEYVRKVFYKENREEFEDLIGESFGAEVKLESASTDARKDIDMIKLSIN